MHYYLSAKATGKVLDTWVAYAILMENSNILSISFSKKEKGENNNLGE